MSTYIEIIKYFLKLGFVGFGGPLALISTMQKDLTQKNWISVQEFNQVFALVKAMPGPIAFQMSVYLGQHRGGFIGGILAGLCLILPAFFMMVGLAIFETIPQFHVIDPFFRGMQVAALGVITASLAPLVKDYVKNLKFIFFSIVALGVVYFYPSYEPLLIIFFGLLVVGWHSKNSLYGFVTPVVVLGSNVAISNQKLFWICFKAGAFVFGSGLAIIPMLEHDFVSNSHWFTHDQFMNALALGQVTPGPITITVTYLGYKLGSWSGAILATLGIYGAAWIHMLTWFPRAIKYLSSAKWMPHFLFGAIAAVVGSVVATTLRMSVNLHLSSVELVLLALSLIVVFKRVLPTWGTILAAGFVYQVCTIVGFLK